MPEKKPSLELFYSWALSVILLILNVTAECSWLWRSVLVLHGRCRVFMKCSGNPSPALLDWLSAEKWPATATHWASSWSEPGASQRSGGKPSRQGGAMPLLMKPYDSIHLLDWAWLHVAAKSLSQLCSIYLVLYLQSVVSWWFEAQYSPLLWFSQLGNVI